MAGFGEALSVADRDVLRAAVAVMDETGVPARAVTGHLAPKLASVRNH